MEMNTSNIQKHFKPTILAAAILGISCTVQAATVNISNTPLTGVTIKHGPNITLTPSVEHPTAGAAYSNNDFMFEGYPTLRLGRREPHLQNQWKVRYLGYFDNTKCYKFHDYNSNADNGYFAVSSVAATDSQGRVGLCSGTDEEYSGNFLNWATMSALDIFRYTLTGGNRARGIASGPSNYQAGDTTTETFLRRAYVNPSSNGTAHYRLRYRGIDLGANPSAQDLAFLKRIIPASMVDSFATVNTTVGLPRALGFRYHPAAAGQKRPHQLVEANVSIKYNNRIFFLNEGFYVTPVRFTDHEVLYQDRTAINVSIAPASVRSIVQKAADASRGKPNVTGYRLPVVVQVCNPASAGGVAGLPEACRAYGGHYKPEGLMQQYGRGNGPDSRPARFSVFSYQLNDTNNVSGGVLRARMKYLDRTQTEGSVVYGKEWDERTGVLEVNPDSYDASQTGVANSGAINYINKFGDAGRYKGLDTSAELFYTAQRYLRRKGMPAYYEQTQRTYGINPTTADGFPMIYQWDDPLTRGLASSSEAQCRSNTMILIGDTFTHDEKDLPNFGSNSGVKDDSEVKTREILEKILDQEQFKGLGSASWDMNRGSGASGGGSGYSPAGLIALAYWGRTQDIRQDIPGDQYINTFTIDVLENGKGRFEQNDSASRGNAYYWAAKYGGFEYEPAKSVNLPNDKRSSWTSDPEGGSSSPVLFPQGMPNNFALGNNPENMRSALIKAFGQASKYTDPSQAFVGVTEHKNSIVDVGANKTLGLQSTYNAEKLTGDVIAQRIGVQGTGLTFTPAWRASTKLEVYHSASGWSSRKLFTESATGSAVQFNPANLSQFSQALSSGNRVTGSLASSLVQYVLGDPTQENSTWRVREGNLMGTVVNSGVQPILPPQQIPAGCAYSNPNIQVRNNYYAVASNAGVLHILDQDGKEVMGYIPSTALPKLYSLALPVENPPHQYLNDGTPIVEEVCFGNSAKTIVVGTAGRGGESVYALDVTDLGSPGTGNIMWEFSKADDADLGLTVGKPTIAKDKDNNPIVIFSSGINSGSSNGYLYVLRADNRGAWQLNSNYWKIPLGQDGVGEPAVYDQDGDKIPESVFVGDLSGKMWRVDYTKSSNTWAKAYGNQPLYTPSGVGAPITAAPYVVQTGGHLYVVAGTGQYFSLPDVSASVQNYAFGFFAERGPVTDADLLGQSFVGDGQKVDALHSTNQTLQQKIYQVTRNALNSSHKGWRLTLHRGQAIVSQPGVRSNRIATFTAVRTLADGTNVCGVNGATALIAVNLQNGGQYSQPIFDTNKDGRFDGRDILGGMVETAGIIAPVGTARETVINGRRYITNIYAGDSGSFTLNTNPLEHALIRRISWREIF